MGWTKEQRQAMEQNGSNLLISAAAGSGKTAVLVERIIRLVCEEGYEIDKILVVTFTKAAAAEMKERIGKRLLEEAAKHPDQGHIQKQLTYIHRAPISTIHSFCMSLLRENFHLISLDPNFRIGEEGEAALLKEQVLDELMEECYEEKEEDFLRLCEAYSYGKDDRAIGDMVLRLYEFAISYPDPDQWLLEAAEDFEIENREPVWLRKVTEYGDRVLKDALDCLSEAVVISEIDPAVEKKYGSFLQKELDELEQIQKAESFDERVKAFSEFSFGRMPAIRKNADLCYEVAQRAKMMRDEAKKMVQALEEDFYQMSVEEIRKESAILLPYARTLVSLVRRFREKYMACKLEKNMLEYSDLEHFALSLLVESYESGNVKKTQLANQLSDYYQAVFTDEYQDSNLIQEVLLQAVSREEDGNRFMVGDIKQSIYRFRMARPELFLEKYNHYGEEGLDIKIELKNNFRSRPELLYSINYIFYQIMHASLGDVEYNEEVALTPPEQDNQEEIMSPGQNRKEEVSSSEQDKTEDIASFEQCKDKDSKKEPAAELILLNLAASQIEGKGEQEEKEDQPAEIEEMTGIELEARMVAEKIKSLPNRNYKDMVILLRTMEGWAQIFEDVLTMEGIPVHTETRTGYFDSFEIRVLLNLLSVVDNLYQDIPMAAVLRSPIGGFRGEDLAKIRSLTLEERREEDNFYDEMVFYLEKGEDETLKEEIRKIMDLLSQLRQEKTWLSLPELIWSAMEKTDYYHLVGSMVNGEQRMANIRMLLEQAKQYEKTSFKGVFPFLRYMDQLRSYEMDYGEASVLGEEDDVVRIMSIHKSKGLEFPVVFLCGLGKQFNLMDQNQRMILHPDYYIGLDCINLEKRSKKTSQQKKIIRKQLMLSTLGEELRVLYVAMTRAKEKLFLTGVVKDFTKMMEKFGSYPGKYLEFSFLGSAKNYLDWIFPALCRHPVMDPYRKSRNIEMKEAYFFPEGGEASFGVSVVAPFELFEKEIKKQSEEMWKKEDFFKWIVEDTHGVRQKEIEKEMNWVYPKEKELAARSKWTVSQLKKEQESEALFLADEEESGTIEFQVSKEETTEHLMPKFIKEPEEMLSGAQRGTAVHKLMEELSFVKVEEAGLEQAVEELMENGMYPKEYQKSLPISQLKRFFASSVGKRITEAEKKGCLWKESQFMMGVPMKELEPETESEELVLVQGVIDLYFEEEDGLVLLDYKTDRVKKGEEDILTRRYAAQLLWYRKALEQMTGKKVKEMILYSFTLSKALLVDKNQKL